MLLKVEQNYKINKELALKLIKEDEFKSYSTSVLFFYNLKRFSKKCGIIKSYYSQLPIIIKETNYCDSSIRKNINKLIALGLAWKIKNKSGNIDLRLASFQKVMELFNIESETNYILKLNRKADVKTVLQTILLSDKIKVTNKFRTIRKIIKGRCTVNAESDLYINVKQILKTDSEITRLSKKLCKNPNAIVKLSRKEIANSVSYKSKSSGSRLVKRQIKMSLVFEKENEKLIAPGLSYKAYLKGFVPMAQPGKYYIYKKGSVLLKESNSVQVNHNVLAKLFI